MEATANATVAEIQARAEAIALKLIADGLKTDDLALDSLCMKLTRFKHLLAGKSVTEKKLLGTLRSGFAMLKYKPGDQSTEAEAILMLHALADLIGRLF